MEVIISNEKATEFAHALVSGGVWDFAKLIVDYCESHKEDYDLFCLKEQKKIQAKPNRRLK